MDKREVEKTAKLARLSFSKEEKSKIPEQLNSILDYISQLNELDTENVDPMNQPIVKNLRLAPDRIAEFDNKEGLAKNAPDYKDGFYRVKKIIE